jgi:hypothetical protein
LDASRLFLQFKRRGIKPSFHSKLTFGLHRLGTAFCRATSDQEEVSIDDPGRASQIGGDIIRAPTSIEAGADMIQFRRREMLALLTVRV